MLHVETCSTPDRGYGGDPKRGASMGRGSRDAAAMRANARAEVERLERSLEDAQNGFNPGWSETDRETGVVTFTPNFPTHADYVAHREELLADARAELEALEASAGETKFHLRKVRLDSGGYDPGGAYWGHGGELFEAWNGAGDFMTVRIRPEHRAAAFVARGGVPIGESGYDEFARRFPNWWRDGSREAAKDAIREVYPLATFFQ
jgi:hypothetical protein